MQAGVLDVGVGYPGEHFLALLQHLLGLGIEVGKDLDGDSGIADERRNLLDEFCGIRLPVRQD